MVKKNTILPILLVISLSSVWVSCGDSHGGAGLPSSATLKDAINTHADMVLQSYTDSRNDAQDLLDAVEAFVANPSVDTHKDAKQAWLAAQESYGQTEVYRFYGGPIDRKDGPEGRLNGWPLDEALIDYVAGTNENANIINNPEDFPEINAEVIQGLNEYLGSEVNVATGFHAVEFLLWGQDNTLGAGGGERPYTDYVIGTKGTNENQDRRGKYLIAAATLIVRDLNDLIDEWNMEGDYRVFFTSEKELNTSLQRIINGMGKLSTGELAGERIAVALATQSPEDEHSCFSDNTHRDIVTNTMGIQNVYLGTYGSISGTGIYDVVAELDHDLANKLRAQIIESVRLSGIIRSPFEAEITDGTSTAPGPGRKRIQAVVTSLESQGALIGQVGTLLGFNFNLSGIDTNEVH